MTEHHDIAEIRNLPEVELIELLPAVESEKLAALRAAEAADNKPRPAVIEAIDKAIADAPKPGQRTDSETAAANAGKPLTKAQRQAAERAAAAKAKQQQSAPDASAAADAVLAAEATPAWQAEDYDGPITIPQAEWRRANLKPARAVREK